MAREKINVPISQAGITRYFEDYKSKIEISPKFVVFVIILVVVIEILLHLI